MDKTLRRITAAQRDKLKIMGWGFRPERAQGAAPTTDELIEVDFGDFTSRFYVTIPQATVREAEPQE
jgi:hypothetical protein